MLHPFTISKQGPNRMQITFLFHQCSDTYWDTIYMILKSYTAFKYGLHEPTKFCFLYVWFTFLLIMLLSEKSLFTTPSVTAVYLILLLLSSLYNLINIALYSVISLRSLLPIALLLVSHNFMWNQSTSYLLLWFISHLLSIHYIMIFRCVTTELLRNELFPCSPDCPLYRSWVLHHLKNCSPALLFPLYLARLWIRCKFMIPSKHQHSYEWQKYIDKKQCMLRLR